METGGAVEWTNNFVDPDTNQRWRITNNGPQLLADVGARNMSEGETLRDFIGYVWADSPRVRLTTYALYAFRNLSA